MRVDPFEMPPTLERVLRAAMAIGLGMLVLSLVAAPDRAWPNLLISVYYLAGLGVGAGFFLAAQYLSGARWSTGIRRVPEAMLSILPAAALGALVLSLGMHSLYAWSRSSAAADEVLRGKSGWLNPSFFVVRIAAYFVAWMWLGRRLVKNSECQDDDRDPVHAQRNVRVSALFVVVGLVTSVGASVDLLMSLEPRWYSTAFAFACLSGSFSSGLAAIVVLVVSLRRMGHREGFRDEHLADLGRLTLCFSTFWVYLWACQHLLIWYANIPEEASYYVVRHAGAWGYLSAANVILNWGIPFLLLLPRASKRNDRVMAAAAGSILIGRWLDLFVTVMPSKFPGAPPFGILEVATFAGAVALFSWTVFRSLGTRRLIPMGEPCWVESLPERVH
jgi:hypothetical protein